MRAYAGIWDLTQHAQSTLRAIELAKRRCAESPEEQERLVDELTADAWRRLAAERPVDDIEPRGAQP